MARILEKGKDFALLYKEAGEDSEKTAPSGMGVLYRLDMPVPGILAAASKGTELEILSKKYFLICSGRLEEETGTMKDFLYHDPRSNRTFPVKKLRKGVKEAELSYEVLGYDDKEDLSFVRVVLETGRTHQIRAQFASRRYPLAGDGKESHWSKTWSTRCIDNGIPTFTLSKEVTYTFYFDNAWSLSRRLQTYEAANVKGVSFWRLGQEDSDIWKILKLK